MRFPVRLQRKGGARRTLQVAAVALLLLATVGGGQLNAFRVGQLASVFIFAIAVSGLNLVSGYGGMLSIGHAALFGLGAYATAVLVVHAHVQPIATLPVVVGVCLVAGLVMGLPALRVRGLYLALVTLAFGVAFPELVARFPSLTNGNLGLSIRSRDLAPPLWSPFDRAHRVQWVYWLSWVLLVVVLLLLKNLSRSRLGLAVRALRDNEIGAVGCGVDPRVTRVVLFGVSGAVTGLAGGLFAMYIGALSAASSFSLLTSIELITGLIIGGAATVSGPVVGGFAIIFIPYYVSSVTNGQAYGLVFCLLLVLFVFVMPDGLVGRLSALARRVVVLEGHRAPVRAAPPPSSRDTPAPDPVAVQPKEST